MRQLQWFCMTRGETCHERLLAAETIEEYRNVVIDYWPEYANYVTPEHFDAVQQLKPILRLMEL